MNLSITRIPKVKVEVQTDGASFRKSYILRHDLTILSLTTIEGTRHIQQSYRENVGNKPGVINIGRQFNRAEGGDFINIADINDLSVSRYHCLINYQQDEMRPRLSSSFVGFLSCCSDRLTRVDEKPKLPKRLGMKVLEYARSPFGYFLRDVKSTFGTKVKLYQPSKIKNVPPTEDMKKEKFVVGDDVFLTIEDILQVKSIGSECDKLNQKIRLLHEKCGQNIHLKKPLAETQSIIVIRVQVQQSCSWHMIYDCSRKVTIGLNTDIRIEQTPFIDYINPQSSVYFEGGSWWICDGDGVCHSVLGTYKTLKDEEERLGEYNEIRLGTYTLLKFQILHQQE